MVSLHQLCPFVVPRPFPSVEKRERPSLTSISLKNSLPFAFGEQGWRSDESIRLLPMWPGFKSRR